MRGGLRFIIVGRRTALHEQAHGTVTEQPHSDISQIEMVVLQLLELTDGGFLQHTLQHLRRTAVADEDAMMAGHRGVEPDAIADDVGLRDWRQWLRGADEDIAADHHRVEPAGGRLHDVLIEGQLERQQVLRKSLSALPSEDGDGCQDLA